MNVLLISTNKLGYPYYTLPLASAYIVATLRARGHAVSFLDLCFEPDGATRRIIQERIARTAPGLVGISVRNYMTFMESPPINYLPLVKEVVTAVRSCAPEVPLVLGGSGFSNNAREILDAIGADTGVVGEGEAAFATIADRVESHRSFQDVPGLIYRQDGGYRENARVCLENLDDLPFPARDIYDERYFTSPGALGVPAPETIQTKRGCIYRCLYCTSVPHVDDGTRFRLRSPQRVVDELEEICRRSPGRRVEVVDHAFNMPIGHAEAICREIVRRGLTVPLSVPCHPYPIESMSRELIALMKQAGVQQIDFETDTCSPKMARSLRRPHFDRESIVTTSRWTREIGISFSHFLLLGAPGEDADTVRESLSAMEEAAPNGTPAVIANVGLCVADNSGLAETARREGVLKEGESLLFPPRFYCSQGLGPEAVSLMRSYTRKHPNWFFVGITLEAMLKDQGDPTAADAGPVALAEKPKLDAPFPEIELPDANGTRTRLPRPGKVMVVVVETRNSARAAYPWIRALKERFGKLEDVALTFIAAIAPLPFFTSREFIVGLIKKEIDPGDNRLIDWSQAVFRGALGLTDQARPAIYVLARDGRLAHCCTQSFSPDLLQTLNETVEAARAA